MGYSMRLYIKLYFLIYIILGIEINVQSKEEYGSSILLSRIF